MLANIKYSLEANIKLPHDEPFLELIVYIVKIFEDKNTENRSIAN